jgi:hypothetical protein
VIALASKCLGYQSSDKINIKIFMMRMARLRIRALLYVHVLINNNTMIEMLIKLITANTSLYSIAVMSCLVLFGSSNKMRLLYSGTFLLSEVAHRLP